MIGKDEVTSENSLGESISSELFTGSMMLSHNNASRLFSLSSSDSSLTWLFLPHCLGSGASMRTLDSGIGTFPMPDYASSMAGKSIPKGKPQGEQGFSCSQGKHGAMMKVPRKAHTLERELSSLDEVNPFVLYGSGLEGKGTNMQLSSTIHEVKLRLCITIGLVVFSCRPFQCWHFTHKKKMLKVHILSVVLI